MKNITLILISIIGLTIACKAQQPIAKITNENIKVAGTLYQINKPNEKITQIINANNKLTNVKMVAPNLPKGLEITGYRKFDKNLLTKLCAEAIPLSTLKKLPLGYNDDLFISIKINAMGEPLEIEFLVKNTSLLSAAELNAVENNILKSAFKVSFTNGIERYFKGLNYFNIHVPIQYSNMLKAKENKQLD